MLLHLSSLTEGIIYLEENLVAKFEDVAGNGDFIQENVPENFDVKKLYYKV